MLERAKHGKRPQRYEQGVGPIALADILYGLQQTEFGKRYFDIRPYADASGAHPSDYRTEVHPCIPEARRSQLLAGFNDTERQLLEGLDEVVRHLGALELRALGTHEDLLETLRDIELEFKKIQHYAAQIERGLDDLPACFPSGEQLLEYADEALKKALENKTNYTTGYSRTSNDIKDPLLREAFAQSQDSPEAIWSASQIEPLAAQARTAVAVANCFLPICFFADRANERVNPRSRQARQMKHYWEEGSGELRKKGTANFPSAIDAVYAGASAKLKTVEASRIGELIHSLQR